MKTLLLVIGSAMSLGSVIPYIRDILRGSTKPNLVSWITWTLLTGIATAAEINAHEYVTAVFTGAGTLATFAVVALGVRHGYVKYTRFDVFCQAAAIAGIILWQIFNSPAIGVGGAVLVDLVGALPTIRHSWLAPHEETWQAFALASLSAVFALGALSAYNWVSLPYPVYLVAANALIAAVIITRARARAVVVS